MWLGSVLGRIQMAKINLIKQREFLMRSRQFIAYLSLLLACALLARDAAGALKTHAIFTSNAVIQRNKPIMIWGWADKGAKVDVQFGDQNAQATAEGEEGRWESSVPLRKPTPPARS